MARPRKKKRARRSARRKAAQPHPGLPAADSVRAVVKFVSPEKVRYTILKTSERDAYDKP